MPTECRESTAALRVKGKVRHGLGAGGSRYDRFIRHGYIPNFDHAVVTAAGKPARLHCAHGELGDLRRCHFKAAADDEME